MTVRLSLRFPSPNTPTGYAFASASLLVAGIVGCVAGLPQFRTTGLPHPDELWSLFNVLDPLLLQGLAGLYALGCVFYWYLTTGETDTDDGRSAGMRAVVALMWSGMALLVLLVTLYALNDKAYKILLGRPRPDLSLRIVVGFLSHGRGTEGGAPSGYASRGVIIFLAAAVAALGLKTVPANRFLRALVHPAVVMTVQAALLVVTCLARVYAGYHFFFDVLLGFALGTFSFWLATLPFAFLANDRRLAYRYVPSLLLASAVFLSVMGLFYSRDAEEWVPIVFAGMLLAVVPEAAARFFGHRGADAQPGCES